MPSFSPRTRSRDTRVRNAPVPVETMERRLLLTIAFNSTGNVPVPDLPTDGGVYQRPLFGDFDNDGKTDVIITAASPFIDGPAGTLSFVKGLGDGTFNNPVQAGQANFHFEPAAGDFNGDGNLDLVVADSGTDALHVFTGNGDGTFAPAVSFAAGDGPFVVRTADLNLDGLTDVVTGNRLTNTLAVRLGDVTTILGDNVPVVTGNDPSSLVIGDFNGDGIPDIAVGNFPDNVINLHAGLGDGTFTAAVPTAGVVAAVVDVGDFNKDGNLDLLRGLDDADLPHVLFGNGDLTFQSAPAPAQTNLATAADLDGDGNLDILRAGVSDDGSFVAVPGNGDGTFGTPLAFGLGATPGGRGAAGDLNGDAFIDAAFIGDATGAASLSPALANPPALANLVPAAVVPLSGSVVGGSAGKVSVRISNNGAARFTGVVPLRLLASTDTLADANDAEVVATTTRLALKPGKSKVVKLKFNYPSNLADASYAILAQVDANGAAPQAPKSDDAASLGIVTIAPPFVDLAASFITPLKSEYKLGRKAKVSVALENQGNIEAKGAVTIELFSSADDTFDTGDTATGASTVKVKIKPGTIRNAKATLVLPEGFAAGTTSLFARVTPIGFTDVISSNDVALADQPFVVV